MEGVKLFIHAVRMVLGNLSVALRIGAVLLVIQLALGLMAGEGYFAQDMGQGGMMAPQISPVVFVLSVAQIIAALWVAVAWHRFILLEEQPGGALPAWNGVAIWSYFKAGFVLALIVVAVAIPMSLIGGLLLLPMMGANAMSPTPLVGLLGFIIIYVPVAYVAYRLSPMLPSAAIGERLSLKDAWFATGTSGFAFVVLTVVSVAAGYLIYLPAALLSGGALTLALAWAAVAQWLSVMVGASIFTTIYGHYVEKRELNA